jgi:UDP-N-acetylglucosamine transferase subunit ALG13
MAHPVASVGATQRASLLGGSAVIFVTVGSMMPFDRLIRGMDKWASENPGVDIFAQIGRGGYEPNNMRWTRKLSPGEFQEAVQKASVLVAHAGMGSFFVAMGSRKPIVLMPRFAAKREHTTDHQLHTVEWLRDKPGVYVAMSDDELESAIAKAQIETSVSFHDLGRFAPQPFLVKLRQFLQN